MGLIGTLHAQAWDVELFLGENRVHSALTSTGELLVAWEVGRAGRPTLRRGEAPADGRRVAAGEVEALFAQVDGVLHTLGYDQAVLRRRILEDLRRLALRAGLTGREARLVRRLLSRVSGRLDEASKPAEGGRVPADSR